MRLKHPKNTVFDQTFDFPFIAPGEYTVENKVRAIVKAMSADVEYLFCNWAQANVAIDGIQKPTIVYVLPANGTFDVRWQQVRDKPETFLAFLSNTELDFDGKKNDNIVEAMKRLAIRFIMTLNQSGYFQQIEGDLPYQVLYDHLDQNVTGIVITPILEEVEGVVICDDIERPKIVNR